MTNRTVSAQAPRVSFFNLRWPKGAWVIALAALFAAMAKGCAASSVDDQVVVSNAETEAPQASTPTPVATAAPEPTAGPQATATPQPTALREPTATRTAVVASRWTGSCSDQTQDLLGDATGSLGAGDIVSASAVIDGTTFVGEIELAASPSALADIASINWGFVIAPTSDSGAGEWSPSAGAYVNTRDFGINGLTLDLPVYDVE